MEEREFRATSAARIFCWIGIVACVPIAMMTSLWASDSGRILEGFVSAFLLILCSLGCWRWGLHPRIVATFTGIEIRNALKTHFVPWRDFASCKTSYRGLTIVRRSGGYVWAFAVQKSNLSVWRHLRTRADDIAEYLARRAEALS